MPNFWTENQGGPAYDELGARDIANNIKLRLSGVTAPTVVAAPTTAASLVTAYLVVATASKKAGDVTEAKRRTGQ